MTLIHGDVKSIDITSTRTTTSYMESLRGLPEDLDQLPYRSQEPDFEQGPSVFNAQLAWCYSSYSNMEPQF